MNGRGDEFYVGYATEAPPGLAAHVRRAAAALLLLAAAVAAALVLSHGPFPPATFEFRRVREFTGILRERPLPTLATADPGGGVWLRFLLVARGKHGAAPEVAGLDGRPVRLSGRLVYREATTLVEIVRGSVEVLPPESVRVVPGPRVEDLGVHTLRGEIVDIKCHSGVMNPGAGRTHRACAARCLSGGIPPVLVVRDEHGQAGVLALVGPAGEPIGRALLDRVAEPVEVTGRVERHDDLLVLRAAPAAVRRLQ